MSLTRDLIPANGVHIIETQYPRGFSVARYDRQGFTADGRWFDSMERAEAYATTLRSGGCSPQPQDK